MRVLVVTAMYPSARRPDSGTFVRDQVETMRSLGVDVDVLEIEGDLSRWAYFRALSTVFRRTFAAEYDVVHAHYGLTGLFAVARWRTPLVLTLHGSDVLGSRWLRLCTRAASLFADVLVPVSNRLAATFPGPVIPCGVDRRRFRPANRGDARSALGLDPGRRYVLFPYRPEYRLKRYDIARQVVQELRRQGLDAEILVASRVAHERMPLYYAAADVLLVCSDRESGPLTVKEAVACECPVVSADVGDVREVASTWSGVRVCERSVPDLAHEVLSSFTARPGPPSEEFNRYSLEVSGRDLLDVYQRVARRSILPLPH